ncbi:MAG: glycoside hydrolase family 3 protein [Phycisphaeraceae bacterium]
MKYLLPLALALLALLTGCAATTPAQPHADALDGWTLEQKVGQILMIADTEVAPEQARDLHLGAILISPNGSHREGVETLNDWRSFYARYQTDNPAFDPTNPSRLPVLLAIDAVHGNALVPGATVFPHNLALAAADRPDLTHQAGRITARETAAIGANWALAPTLAITRDHRWGRTYEGWGSTPDHARNHARAFITGVQNEKPAGHPVLACAKHFVGDGEPTWGTGRDGGIDRGDVRLTRDQLRKIHVPPFQEAIDAGVASIMVNYGSFNGTRAHHHPWLLQNLLRDELGFQGVVVSDFNGFALDRPLAEGALNSLNSGVDLLMVGKNWRDVRTRLLEAARTGELHLSRLDQAVTRVLEMKKRATPAPDAAPRARLDDTFASRRAYQVAHELVASSIVELSDPENLLPLKNPRRILVLGPKADNLAVQAGGWTLGWGGFSDPHDPRFHGRTILDGLQNGADKTGAELAYHPQGAPDPGMKTGYDVCIVVIGEQPYAEWFGDNPQPSLSEEDQLLLQQADALDLPTVAVLLTGRPLHLGDWLTRIDAWAVAWLPGSAADAVAAPLLGQHPFTGHLPLPWPTPTQPD